MSETITEQVTDLYRAALGRAPEPAGLAYWVNAANSGFPEPAIAAYFASSPEFVAHYGALMNDQFVNLLYENVLGRKGDAGGVQYWEGALANGSTRADVLNGFALSPEFANLPPPTTTTEPPPVVQPPPTTTPPPTTQPTSPSDINISANTTLNQGTATSPFVTGDIIGSNVGMGLPTLSMAGFIHSGDVQNLSALNIGASATQDGHVLVNSISNVGDLTVAGTGASYLEIAQTLDPSAEVTLGNDAQSGSPPVTTLVLDQVPTGGHLANFISMNGVSGARIEIGDLQFNGWNFTSNNPTAQSGPARLGAGGSFALTQDGTPIGFTLDHILPSGMGISTGVDATTGKSYLQIT